MNPQEIIEQVKTKLTAAEAHFAEELKKLRTGRAHASMLDGVIVQAYGAPMPLNQVATITAPEAQLLQISPFDPSNLQAISMAIRENQNLGLNPMDDGRVVRIQVPPLTTERRQQIAKSLGEKLEECMISMRAVRHEARETADKAKKDKAITEDDLESLNKRIDELMNSHKLEAESLASAKEQEIMKV